MRKELLEILPKHISRMIGTLPKDKILDIEEIRLRINKPLIINARNQDIFFDKNDRYTLIPTQTYEVTKEDVEKTYQMITDYSVYALEEEIKSGYITIKGGHRIGLCGKVVLDGNKIKTIKNISGLNVRVSKQKIGVSNKIMPQLIIDGNFCNTLIISPPQCGKTTLLRDIIRNLSNGMKCPKFKGFKVGVVDERSEICGIYQSIPQNDMGIRTDILDSCPKAEGMIMLIRSMSPQIIATDEIGKMEDAYAIQEALNAGVKVITTVHGNTLEEVKNRPNLKELMTQNIFEKIIILSNVPKVGTAKEIIDLKEI